MRAKVRSVRFFALSRPFSSILPRWNQVFEREHPLEVVTQTYQGPFQRDFGPTTEQETPESHHLFDNPKDRLHCLLAQFVKRLARLGFQAVRHDLLGRSLWTQRWCLGLRQ